MKNIKEYVVERKSQIKKQVTEHKLDIKLGIIQVGSVEASNRYVRNKIKDCNEVGYDVALKHIDTQNNWIEQLLTAIEEFNNDSSITAFMVQFPLPDKTVEKLMMNSINATKDADGFTGEIVNPCTPQGIITYLERNEYDFNDKNALIIGRSDIVGKPMAKLLTEHDCNVTLVHSKTSRKNLNTYIKNADLIVVATGHPHTLNSFDFGTPVGICNNKTLYQMPDSSDKIVFDVGINFENDRMIGDCDRLPVMWQSPVPGGVGLLTRLQLLENILKLYEIKHCNEAKRID